jgi:hypothetical protein
MAAIAIFGSLVTASGFVVLIPKAVHGHFWFHCAASFLLIALGFAISFHAEPLQTLTGRSTCWIFQFIVVSSGSPEVAYILLPRGFL